MRVASIAGFLLMLVAAVVGAGVGWLLYRMGSRHSVAGPLGRTRESRVEIERVDANRWRRTQRVSEDGGTTWSVSFTDELERNR